MELGCDTFYTVPGDFNLVQRARAVGTDACRCGKLAGSQPATPQGFLDELLKEPRLKMVNTCNELNAAYAADGYARVKGVRSLPGQRGAQASLTQHTQAAPASAGIACVAVTFTVGGLSMIKWGRAEPPVQG